MKQLTAFFKLSIFIPLLLVACLTRAQEVDDEREFSYEENSEIGPAHWGEIRPEWKECSSGEMQSPIDLLNERVEVVSHLGKLKRSYKPSNTTLINRGHDMMLRWPGGAGHININGTLYQLKQCHWHSPSEHTISGRRFDMEVHLVHQSDDNRIAVIGIMYKIGRPDSFLSMMKRNLKAVAEMRDVEKTIGIIDPKLIKLGSRKYYRYIGSLTTPPCTQNVIWTIVRKVRTVTREQVELIRDVVHDDSEANARPIQPVHERLVELYRPRDGN
ncbi:alpha carbonic anhydrase 7 [Sesamum indicum]|uniref:Carbonic anhydrase n=1 Tax=Sesamum indicum TaxID=4182 RepID=A0A8M8V8C1_SESIN|nr:alpha carbonic anhydrase 7 [Sesamum indicum]